MSGAMYCLRIIKTSVVFNYNLVLKLNCGKCLLCDQMLKIIFSLTFFYCRDNYYLCGVFEDDRNTYSLKLKLKIK